MKIAIEESLKKLFETLSQQAIKKHPENNSSMIQISRLSDRKFIWMVLVLLFMPFSIRLCSYVIIAFLLDTIVMACLTKSDFDFHKKTSFWIPFSLLIVTLFGLLFTSDLRTGFRAVEIQSSLLIFPFIFSQLGISQIEFNKIKVVYIALLLFLCLGLEFRIILIMLNSGYEFLTYFFSFDYTYENLTTEFVAQPVYLGTYITLSNIFCLSFFNSERKNIQKYVVILIVLFNTFFLFQLAARSSIIINALLVVSYLFIILYKKRNLYLGGITIGIGLTGAVFLFNSSGFTRLRMLGFIEEIRSDNLRAYDPKSRMLIWPCAIEVIEGHWMFGVGTGDAESSLRDIYKKRGLEELYKSELNAHNEYLTLMMRHGLLGIVVILVSIVLVLYLFWKDRNIEAFLFTCLMAGFFVTENVLSRAQGVIFFGFFQSIFLVMTDSKKQNENTYLRH